MERNYQKKKRSDINSYLLQLSKIEQLSHETKDISWDLFRMKTALPSHLMLPLMRLSTDEAEPAVQVESTAKLFSLPHASTMCVIPLMVCRCSSVHRNLTGIKVKNCLQTINWGHRHVVMTAM